jgi:molybdopterin biosynthesis enzyme MoaB
MSEETQKKMIDLLKMYIQKAKTEKSQQHIINDAIAQLKTNLIEIKKDAQTLMNDGR